MFERYYLPPFAWLFHLLVIYCLSPHYIGECVVCGHWPARALRLVMSVFLCFCLCLNDKCWFPQTIDPETQASYFFTACIYRNDISVHISSQGEIKPDGYLIFFVDFLLVIIEEMMLKLV